MLLPGNEKMPFKMLQMVLTDNTHKTPEFLVSRALRVILAIMRTSATLRTHLLCHLCPRPEYINTLRSEVKSMVGEEIGLSNASLHRLVKRDYFMKESRHIDSPLPCELLRRSK